MDPITHALSGAVLSRALPLRLDDEPAARTARWALILGSIFPDIDVVAKPFDPDNFATIRVHRSVTHSFVCLPFWAILFAILAVWFCRRRGIPAPRRGTLGAMFGAGIGLHILFDCITSFGTMVWSPLAWTRVQWDWTFIVDLALTGVLLFFLLLSWVAEEEKHRPVRAAWMLALMSTLLGAFAMGSYVLARPVPAWLAAGMLLLAAVPWIVARTGAPLLLTARSWCHVGLLATAAYLGMNAWAHHRALQRVREYAAVAHLGVIEAAAIPLPPNFTVWQGFVRTPDSVHEWAISLVDPPSRRPAASVAPAVSGEACPAVLWTIPQVRAWMRFARFPVVVCRPAPSGVAAEFTDLRFQRPALHREERAGREPPIPFTWRVTFDDGGRVISEGWVIR
jgi:membrane-bound metal-dependent hydrolase YbcI (DUF457 family)